MKGFVSHLALVSAIVASGLISVHAQVQPAPVQQTFRSSVDLVTIQASVRDKRGRLVQGLSPDDFEVRDNGELRPVITVRADGQSPVSVAVVVDMSGSMNVGSRIALARRTFDALLAQLRTGEDEVGLFTFDSSLFERGAFTKNLPSFD